MKLNDQKCRNATRAKDGSKLFDGRGLYLELHKNSSKYWRYKYRINGKEKLLALGVYPETGLAEARELHRAAHKLAAGGSDPGKIKKLQKAEQQNNTKNTFKAIALDWHEIKSIEWTDKYANTILKRLEADIFPLIGSIPVRGITPPMGLSS